MKTIDVAVKLLANKIYNQFKILERDVSNNTLKEFDYNLNNFCDDLKIELKKDEKELNDGCALSCDDSLLTYPLDKFSNKYTTVYKYFPIYFRIFITNDYVYDDSEYRCDSKIKNYVACSKDYVLKEINFYKDAKENHSYVFYDAKERIKDWEDFLKKFDGKDFYIREDLRESDNIEKEENIENDDSNFDDSIE